LIVNQPTGGRAALAGASALPVRRRLPELIKNVKLKINNERKCPHQIKPQHGYLLRQHPSFLILHF